MNGFVCDFIDLVSLTLYIKVSNTHKQKLIDLVKSYYYDLSVWCNVLNNDLFSSDCFYSHQCNACISKFADTNNYCNWLQVH